jgi:membrane-associated protein
VSDVTGLLVEPLLFGLKWMDPNWLLDTFGHQMFWVSVAIIFVECGLFFPFLPGDTLLFATGLFVAAHRMDVNLVFALAAFTVAAFLGNVAGYEIGRAIGPALYDRGGRLLKREYFETTGEFFDKHGSKALVIGRFVPFVRTFITVVAGVTRMDRNRFFRWSAVGALLWVLTITLLGYFLGKSIPGLGENIDKAILVLLAFSVLPICWEWWRKRRHATAAD